MNRVDPMGLDDAPAAPPAPDRWIRERAWNDPISLGRAIIERGLWIWTVVGKTPENNPPGEQRNGYERWRAGEITPEEIASANCYQFIWFILEFFGVQERPLPRPVEVTERDGAVVERPITEEAAVLIQDPTAKPGTKQYDDASKRRGLREYLDRYAGNFDIAGPGYRPKKGDIVIFFERDDSGSLQAMHVGMYTGKPDEIIHNTEPGPQVGSTQARSAFVWDETVVFEYLGWKVIPGRSPPPPPSQSPRGPRQE